MTESPESASDFCGLCGIQRKGSSPDGNQVILPGSDGCNLLNDDLKLYFISEKMLQLSKPETLSVIYELYSDQGTWKSCDQCGESVNKGIQLYLEILKLQREIVEVGKRLQRTISEGWETGQDSRSRTANKLKSILYKEKRVKVEASPAEISVEDDDGSLNGFEDFETSSPIGNHESNTEDQLDEGVKYPCEMCASVYTTIVGFKKHLKMHEASTLLGNKFDCATCKHPTTSEKNLRRHMTSAHLVKSIKPLKNGDHLRRHKCDICEAKFRHLPNLEIHLKVHQKCDLLGNVFDCPSCKYPNSSAKRLARHLITVHKKLIDDGALQLPESGLEPLRYEHCTVPDLFTRGSDGVFYCKRCESKYSTIPGVKKHERRHQESDELGHVHDCGICKHPNGTDHQLRVHMTRVHNIRLAPQYSANGASSRTKVKVTPLSKKRRKRKMKREKVDDSDDEEWSPNEEDDNKSRPITKKKRKSTVVQSEKMPFSNLFVKGEGELWSCKRCESTYTTVPGLTKHKRMHEESDELGNVFDCKVCRHPNGSESKLRRHMTTVHGTKSIKLEVDREETMTANLTDEKDQERLSPTTTSQPRTPTESFDDDHDDKISSGDDTMDDDDWVSEKIRMDGKEWKADLLSQNDTGFYYCEKCNVNYKSKRGYQRHEEEHQLSTSLGHKFDCSCGFPASSEKRLRYHKKLAHLEILTCPICNFSVKTTEQLREHMRKHKSSSIKRARLKLKKLYEKKIKCDHCGERCSGQDAFNDHLKEHEAKGDLYTCRICGHPCQTYEKLKEHRVEEHLKKGLICRTCNKPFTDYVRLKRHENSHKETEQLKDPVTGQFHCKLCSFIGRSRRSLSIHMNIVHQEQTLTDSGVPYPLCPHCGKSFRTVGKLQQHIKNIHENIYKYNCELCGKGSDSKVKFENHKLSHVDKSVRQKEHICDTCGAEYTYKQSLTAHIARYHTETVNSKVIPASRHFPKEKRQDCKYCAMTFPFRYMLLSHLQNAHPDVYKFPCDECVRKYTSASSLRLHKEIVHSGAEAFTCEYCQRTLDHRHYAHRHYKYCTEKRKFDEQAQNADGNK